MNQDQLVKAAQSGDREAFRELVTMLESRVASTVIGMLGHCQEAEDVGQETFIRFYKSLGSFRGDAKIETYVTRIAINLSINELKRRQRRFGVFKDQKYEELENLSSSDNPGLDKETHDMVHWGIQQLPVKYRSVLILRLIDGYSTKETAEILEISLGTVLSRLSRAQKKLKTILEPVYWSN